MTDALTPAQMGARAAEALLGTCQALYNLGEEFEALEGDMEFCDALDDRVFCCVRCGWWFEQPAEERNGEWVCLECAEEDDA